MTKTPVRLTALATTVPPFVLEQSEVALRARKLFFESGGASVERLLPVFKNAGIDRRYSCAGIDWYEEPHGWRDRNGLYLDNATALLTDAAEKCLHQSGLRPDQIDAVVAVSTTGIATPSLDALLINRLKLRPDVRRLPIFGLGCAGGVLGLARAVDLARGTPGMRVLFVVVELCALSFRKNDFGKSNIVATALFGDGAAAAIIESGGEGEGPVFGASGEHTWPDTLDIMGWEVDEDGMKAIFSRDIPSLVKTRMRPAAEAFLARFGIALSEIDHLVPHPGGVKVLSALEESLELQDGALDDAREVLRDYGNMSAVTVWFVLDRMLKAGRRGRMLMSALGPGFTVGFQILDVA